MKKLIINADDFGYSKAVSYGILDSHKAGILTSTTMMMNTEATEHAVNLAKETPTLGIGVHLVLTFGKPLLNTHRSIVDENGNFRKLSYYESPGFFINNEEVFHEWDAQIKKFLFSGLVPTHLDSHHHINSFGELYKVYFKLAEKYNLPVRKNVDSELIKKYGIRTTDSFETEYSEVLDKVETINELFEKNDSIEVMTHPSYLDKFLLENSSFTYLRLEETEFLTNKERTEKFKKSKQFKLVNFGDL